MSIALLFRIEMALSITFTGEKGIFSSTIFLFSSLARSKISLTKNNILLALFFKAPKCFFWELFRLVLSKSSDAEITAESGVLIS